VDSLLKWRAINGQPPSGPSGGVIENPDKRRDAEWKLSTAISDLNSGSGMTRGGRRGNQGNDAILQARMATVDARQNALNRLDGQENAQMRERGLNRQNRLEQEKLGAEREQGLEQGNLARQRLGLDNRRLNMDNQSFGFNSELARRRMALEEQEAGNSNQLANLQLEEAAQRRAAQNEYLSAVNSGDEKKIESAQRKLQAILGGGTGKAQGEWGLGSRKTSNQAEGTTMETPLVYNKSTGEVREIQATPDNDPVVQQILASNVSDERKQP
jgi:hypothetical protein